MRGFMLMLSLYFFCHEATADWVKEVESGDYIFYVNPSSVRKNQDKIKIWVMKDFRNAIVEEDNKMHLSEKILAEYECKKKLMRFVTAFKYTGNMTEGEIVRYVNYEFASWIPVPPDGNWIGIWNTYCIVK